MKFKIRKTHLWFSKSGEWPSVGKVGSGRVANGLLGHTVIFHFWLLVRKWIYIGRVIKLLHLVIFRHMSPDFIPQQNLISCQGLVSGLKTGVGWEL